MIDIIECDLFHYYQQSNLLHFEEKVFVSNSMEPYKNLDALVYFNRHANCVHVFAEEDMELVLYRNRDLIQKIATPKPFIVSAIFAKNIMFNLHFESQMHFNQWCFDNDLTHNLTKENVQIYAYLDAFIRHPLTGDLCIPPILIAKSHPDLILSSSIAEITNLYPFIIPVKKGQGIHFDKYLYQCQLPAHAKIVEVVYER